MIQFCFSLFWDRTNTSGRFVAKDIRDNSKGRAAIVLTDKQLNAIRDTLVENHFFDLPSTSEWAMSCPCECNLATRKKSLYGEKLSIPRIRRKCTSLHPITAVGSSEAKRCIPVASCRTRVKAQRIVVFDIHSSFSYLKLPHYPGSSGTNRLLTRLFL